MKHVDVIERLQRIRQFYRDTIEDYTAVEAVDMAIEAVEKQEADRWHSVAKEGNPPKIGYYLWSARGGNVDIDFYDGEKWGKASKYLYEVLAWKYRPEPYTEEEA